MSGNDGFAISIILNVPVQFLLTIPPKEKRRQRQWVIYNLLRCQASVITRLNRVINDSVTNIFTAAITTSRGKNYQIWQKITTS